jgi:hypothetical protein
VEQARALTGKQCRQGAREEQPSGSGHFLRPGQDDGTHPHEDPPQYRPAGRRRASADALPACGRLR